MGPDKRGIYLVKVSDGVGELVDFDAYGLHGERKALINGFNAALRQVRTPRFELLRLAIHRTLLDQSVDRWSEHLTTDRAVSVRSVIATTATHQQMERLERDLIHPIDGLLHELGRRTLSVDEAHERIDAAVARAISA